MELIDLAGMLASMANMPAKYARVSEEVLVGQFETLGGCLFRSKVPIRKVRPHSYSNVCTTVYSFSVPF